MSDLDDSANPCIACGICCTHFRISFYWAEADDAPGGHVPADMTEQLNPYLRCMKGSNQVPRRCIALEGELGKAVSCSIYPLRPTPCREFPVYFEDGSPNPRCDELRAKIGLGPLPHLAPPPPAAEILLADEAPIRVPQETLSDVLPEMAAGLGVTTVEVAADALPGVLNAGEDLPHSGHH